MPLYANGLELIRVNLELIQSGERPKVVSVGYLTAQQHQDINTIRAASGMPLLAEPIVLFMGGHLYRSRNADGYSIAEMLVMIEHSMDATAQAHATKRFTGLQGKTSRQDAYGNTITDLAVLELYSRRPKAELFSVIPKGDSGNRPIDQGK